MSHIVSIETKVHDVQAVAAACQRLGLAAPVEGTAELFSGTAQGLIVKLPGWEYPAVIDTLSGSVRGAWGDPAELWRLLQMYAVEKAKLEVRKKGYVVSEQALENGSIKVQIIEGQLTMATPRRQLVRPLSHSSPASRHSQQLQSLRTRLERERQALQRWMVRLKRAFHALEKQQGRVARLERRLRQLETSA